MISRAITRHLRVEIALVQVTADCLSNFGTISLTPVDAWWRHGIEFFFFFFKLFAAQLLSSWWFDTPQCSCDVTVIWKIASLKTKLFVDADLASTTVWTSSYWSPYTPGEKHSFELSNSWILIHGNPFKSFKMFCHFTETLINLTHWGRVTHICVRKLDQHCSR